MEKTVKNKTVVVTGGAAGIGHEIVNHVLKAGAKTVVILDINEKVGVEVAKQFNEIYGKSKAVFIQCDITKDLETVSKQILSTFTTVDVLINNAGIVREDDWKKCIDINLKYLVGWSLTFWEHMRKDKGGFGGTILNIASLYGIIAHQFLPIYHASKFGVMGFTRSLGHEYNFKKTGVRVIALCPGFTETILISDVKDAQADYFGDDKANYLKEQLWQTPDAVGKGAVDILEMAASGEGWTIIGSKPIEKVV